MSKAVCSTGKDDPGGFLQLCTVLIRLADSSEKFVKKTKDTFLLLKAERFGDPRPGMLVYRIARAKDCGQVLRVDGQKLFCLRELRPRELHDDRNNDLPEAVSMR